MFALLDGPGEIAILVIVVLVLFGGSQIPKLAKNLGKAQTEFKKGLDQGHKEADTDPLATETIDQKRARLAELDKVNTEKQDKAADA
ncbi:MAG: twin arginine-targeting protein translocase, TatA/E family [Acidimicrobiales bacterium]|nr:twin arginine-targeting protein translocase, TatA/E family [Acidimicrobiales bacterium]